MTQPLFFTPNLEFTKVAAENSVPEDPNEWPQEILQNAHKQIPYISDFEVEIVMDEVDGERGYGLGHLEVSSRTEAPKTSDPEQLEAAGIRSARIPIIIKDNKIQPFDVVVTDTSNIFPLTESRLRQAMFRPQMFDVTSKSPGDQSMVGQLYPPFRQGYGFGGGGMASAAGKMASVNSLLQVALHNANQEDLHSFKKELATSPSVKLAYANNPATYTALELINEAKPGGATKYAGVISKLVRPTVTQITLEDEGYGVKEASYKAWCPSKEILSRGELVARFGEKVALAADLNSGVTMAEGEGVAEATQDAPDAMPVEEPGSYVVHTVEGQALTGQVIPNLIDIDGKSLPISLYTDGENSTVQSSIIGSPVGGAEALPSVPANKARGTGFFVSVDQEELQATIPMNFTVAQRAEEGGVTLTGETFDGRPVNVSIQPFLISVHLVDGKTIVPDSWGWVSLDKAADITLLSDEPPAKEASAEAFLSTVTVRGGGVDSFSISGYPVEKLGSDQTQFLSFSDALFLLGGLGCNIDYAQTKLAKASTGYSPETVRVGHVLKTAEEVRGESYVKAEDYLNSVPVFRQRLWKEAAALPDPTAVDAVLSLGFINPENISIFVGYLPILDEAQSRLCELLIASRLGIKELPEGALEKSVRSLEHVIEGLKVLAH